MKKKENNSIQLFKLNQMVKGWFIGNFNPSLFTTNDVEVGIKEYVEGDFEIAHYHKIATEFTVVVSGEIEMSGVKYSKGDIIKINPGVATDFKAITDAVTVVVKIPGANNDKYI